MYPGKSESSQNHHSVFFKRDPWNISLEKQEIQVRFLLKKTKQKSKTSKITSYPTFGKPALTNATSQTSGKCHT